ncbi:MAG: hypothetical protein ACOY17_09385 [Pseudomonadota bacterium]
MKAAEIPDWDPGPCGMSVRTDSLTVFVDLNRMPAPVAASFCRTLGIPEEYGGSFLPCSDGSALQQKARQEFLDLLESDPALAFQYATALSAFIHETRHVHDLRATRIGAELLLSEFEVYSGVQRSISSLRNWLEKDSNRRIRIPLNRTISQYLADDLFPSDPLRRSVEVAQRTASYWDAPSRFQTVPGTSIRHIYEALGFVTQIEWVREVFGPEVANELAEKILGGEPWGSPYYRPLNILANVCHARGLEFDPEPHDVSLLLFEALNMVGLDQAFRNGVPTDHHPGAWFDRFAHYYANVATRNDVPPEKKARAAVWLALRSEGFDDLSTRIELADRHIAEKQDQLLKGVIENATSGEGGDEALLLLSEIGIDFRDMQRIISKDEGYFISTQYVDALMRGDFHYVFVRVLTEDRRLEDFRTASSMPGNHPGGVRHASLNSQIARLLISGRNIRSGTFFEEIVFDDLTIDLADSHGLRFRVVF